MFRTGGNCPTCLILVRANQKQGLVRSRRRAGLPDREGHRRPAQEKILGCN